MVKVRGREAVRRYIADVPEKLMRSVLPGAARAGGTVVADEIKLRTTSDEVRKNVRMRTSQADGQVRVRIDLPPGWARSLGIWLEYGTDPHFISVDDSQRDGRSSRRINTQLREAGGDTALVIGGQFVGKTVFHPGSQAYPSFRPALDFKETEAIAAAQAYINTRITRAGIIDTPELKDDE